MTVAEIRQIRMTTFQYVSQPVWRPILDKSESRRVDGIVTAVANALAESPLLRLCGGGLSQGAAGAAVFLSYLARARSTVPNWDRSSAWLAFAARNSPVTRDSLGLFAGATGVAWAVQHLGLSLPSGTVDPRPAVDALLAEQLAMRPCHSHYDLVSGLVGYGVYALERLDTLGPSLLQGVIDCLDELAVPDDRGITWWTGPHLLPAEVRVRHSRGYFNLGLAHGVAGVIALLARACVLGIAPATAHRLLDGAVSWLFAHRNPETAESYFDYVISTGKLDSARSSRVAWCYGDLGIAAALYFAATSVQQVYLAKETLGIARRAAQRGIAQAGVVDAGLCHGAAGIAHIFNRLYQASGEELFREAACNWFKRCVDFHHPGIGVGGYRAWIGAVPAGQKPWSDSPGLMIGAAGIGLSLLAAIAHDEPKWDRMLLVNLPVGMAAPG